MGKKFAEYSKLDLSEVNGKVLKKWDENQVFAKSMTEREGCPDGILMDCPWNWVWKKHSALRKRILARLFP